MSITLRICRMGTYTLLVGSAALALVFPAKATDYRTAVELWAQRVAFADPIERFSVDEVVGIQWPIITASTNHACYSLRADGSLFAFVNYHRRAENVREVPIASTNPIPTDEVAVSRARAFLRITGFSTGWAVVSVDRPYLRPPTDITGRPRSDVATVMVTFSDAVGPHRQRLNFVKIGMDERDGQLLRVQSRTGWTYSEPATLLSRTEAAAVIRRLFERKQWPWPGDAVVAESLTLGLSMPSGSMSRPPNHPTNLNFGDDYSYRLWRQLRARLAYTFISGRYGAVIDAENGRPLLEGGTKSGLNPQSAAPAKTSAAPKSPIQTEPRPTQAQGTGTPSTGLWLGLGGMIAALLGAGWMANRRMGG